MGPRRLIVLLVALAAAGGTALYTRSWIASQQPVSEAAQPTVVRVEEEFQEVLVAGEDLPAGTFVTPNVVRWQRWPSGDLPATYFVRGERDVDAVVGAVVRRGVAAGQPLADGGVVMPGDRGFLAAVLEPGMRAVSVPINDTSGNAGLIFPGDRVDLILTQTVTDGADNKRLASETVLDGIRIIAMGTRISDDEAVIKDPNIRTATLEVTPRQAEAVALVTELGKLSLSLRSLAVPDGSGDDAVDASSAPPAAAPPRQEVERATWDRDVSRVRRAEEEVARRLVVVRGGEKSEIAIPGNEP